MTRAVGDARKPWFVSLARFYVRRLLARSFDGLHVAGLERARALVASESVIIASTHVSWWDALLAIYLDGVVGSEGHCYMDAVNLKKLPFFGWTGAVPLDRTSPRLALADLNAGAALAKPGSALWIFPQGRQRRTSVRPLGLHSGTSRAAKKSGARVLPLALDYVWREDRRPAIVASFGTPLSGHGRPLMEELERELIAGLASMDDFVDGIETPFEALLPGACSQGVPLSGRLLAAFAKGER